MSSETNVETGAAPSKPYFPAIWPSIGWVALFMLLQVIAGVAALMTAILTNDSGREPMELARDMSVIALPTIWSLVLSSLLTLFLLWRYLAKGDRMAAVRLDRWSELPLVHTLLLAVVLIGAGLGFNLFYSAYIVPDIEIQAELRKLFAAIPPSLVNSALLFVAVAIIAPVLEEILFRGLLQNALAHKLPIWAAIFLSALVFGAVHGDFYAMPPLVMMGAVFGYLYYKTGSLRMNIALHMINNAAALALG
jgi:uncharacterized protein